jgi:Saccharopine dehydrogenase NADP binding domain
MGKRILVLGGYGTFGRRISRAIAAMPSAECVVGGRQPQKAAPVAGENITTITVNVHDPASLRLALEGVFAVVNAVWPFQAGDYAVAEACAVRGIHYVDLADARAHVEGITRLNRRAQQHDCLIVSGASSVPAVSAALVDMLAPEFDRINEIHTSISTGNQDPRAPAAVRAVLGYAGSPIRLKDKGRWRYGYGWSESEKVRFPRPVGKRRVYLCDVPDLDLFPTRYGAQTVTFRAGLELGLFNRGLVLLGRMRRWGWVKNLPGWAPGLIAASKLWRGSGGVTGGMRVLVRGRKDDRDAEHTVFLMTRDVNGPAIPCSPAVALIRRWVERGVTTPGAVPCVGLLTWDDIRAEMVDFDITLVRI